jgi:acyl-coenzyme A synthetase/AMP-(fatty) acid ligase
MICLIGAREEEYMSADFDYEKLRREYRIDYPEHFNFGFDILDRHAAENGNRLALHFVDEDLSEERLTFRDIRVHSNRIANFLRALGVEHGQYVLIMLPRIPAWWLNMVALAKLEAISVPCATTLSARDLEYRINKAHISVVITTPGDADKFESIRNEIPTVKRFILIGGEEREGWIDFWAGVRLAGSDFVPIGGAESTHIDTPMLLYFTSGTTGYPKMVLHTHAYALAHRATAEIWQDLKPTDTIWTITDTGWAKIAWGALFGQWYVGATVFVHQYTQFRAERTLSFITKYGVTIFCAPPTAYRVLILEDLKKHDFSELRHCTSAGEPLTPDVIETWKKNSGIDIYEGYGQSESVLLIGTYPGMPIRVGSMGKASPLFDIRIINNELQDAPTGTEGDIAVRVQPEYPNGLFKGYLEDSTLNAEVFKGDWYITGDRAYQDADGYFWFVGRADDVIKSLGIRIGPFEVESALAEHEAVIESAVIGVSDRMKGQRVKAFVVLKPEFTPSPRLAREIQDHVISVTAKYKCPKEIEFVDELPKTSSGKIRRAELREREAKKAGQKPGKKGHAPRTTSHTNNT